MKNLMKSASCRNTAKFVWQNNRPKFSGENAGECENKENEEVKIDFSKKALKFMKRSGYEIVVDGKNVSFSKNKEGGKGVVSEGLSSLRNVKHVTAYYYKNKLTITLSKFSGKTAIVEITKSLFVKGAYDFTLNSLDFSEF